MGLNFLKDHGAMRTTGKDVAGNPFANMQTVAIRQALDNYEMMSRTGQTATGKALGENELRVIDRQIAKMHAELASRFARR